LLPRNGDDWSIRSRQRDGGHDPLPLLAQISTARRRHLSDAAMSVPVVGITIP